MHKSLNNDDNNNELQYNNYGSNVDLITGMWLFDRMALLISCALTVATAIQPEMELCAGPLSFFSWRNYERKL